jgi:hypothetical protein
MVPKSLQTNFVIPALSVSRGKEQVKIVNSSLKVDSFFDNENNAYYNWRRSLKNINLELAFDKISGIWEKINILSTKNQISAKAELGFKNSVLYFKKISAGGDAEKTVAYSKFWKLASRKISANSTGSGTMDSKLILKPKLRLHGFYISSHDASLRVPEVLMTADLADGKVSGNVSYNNATFYKNNLNLVCRQISMGLPFGADAAEGKLDINKVELRKRNIGKINAKLKIKDDNLLINASHFSEIFSNAGMFFSGKMKLADFPASHCSIKPDAANSFFPGLIPGQYDQMPFSLFPVTKLAPVNRTAIFRLIIFIKYPGHA